MSAVLNVMMVNAAREGCEGRCEAPPNKGIRQTWWCGFRKSGGRTTDHDEHDHYHKGQWFHCYG